MHLAISVPTGYHARELILPLKSLIEEDTDISRVTVITPAADHSQQIFPTFGEPWHFVANPATAGQHSELLSQLNPDLVITDTNGLDYRDVPILIAAKKRKIPTLTFVASWDNVWKMGRSNKAREPRENAEFFIVWNTMMRDHLLRLYNELNPDQIAVIGSPRFDYFHHADKVPSREQLLAYLDIPNDGRKLIHFATTELYPMEYLIKQIARAKDQGQLNHPVHLYASVHPGGDMDKHQHYAAKYNVTVRFSFGRQDDSPNKNFKYNPSLDDIYRLIALFKHADLLINQSSTVALESFAGHTPVINAKYGQPFDWWHWHRSAVYKDFKQHYADILRDSPSQVVYNSKQLIAATNSYLDNPDLDQANRERNLARLTTITDGTASQQVLDSIKKHAAA